MSHGWTSLNRWVWCVWPWNKRQAPFFYSLTEHTHLFMCGGPCHSFMGPDFPLRTACIKYKKKHISEFPSWPCSLWCCIVNNKSLMRCSVCPWLTRPSSLSLSLSLSVVFCPTAWRIRYASSERGFEDLKTNYWIDVRQAVVSLPCFFSASALLLPSSTSFQSLSLSLFFLLSRLPWRGGKQHVFFFCNTALHRLPHLSVCSTV